jgi:hypothetical protein
MEMIFRSKITQSAVTRKQMLLRVSCLFLRKIISESRIRKKGKGLFELRDNRTGALLPELRAGEYGAQGNILAYGDSFFL